MEREIQKMVADLQARKPRKTKPKHPHSAMGQNYDVRMGRYFANKKPMTKKQRKARARAKLRNRG